MYWGAGKADCREVVRTTRRQRMCSTETLKMLEKKVRPPKQAKGKKRRGQDKVVAQAKKGPKKQGIKNGAKLVNDAVPVCVPSRR